MSDKPRVDMDPPVLVVDLEATCERDVPEWPYEVIEIGAVVLAHGVVTDRWEAFVRPSINPELTPFCQQLTGIRQGEVDAAQGFPAVIGALGRWLDGKGVRSWASWGVSDARLLASECARHGVPNPLEGLEHFNLKKDFAKRRRIKQVGLKKALEIEGLSPSAQHHRALSDAIAAAALMSGPCLG